MCSGAIFQTRINHVIFGIKNPKMELRDNNITKQSSFESNKNSYLINNLFSLLSSYTCAHSIDVLGGILSNNCQKLWNEFISKEYIQ